MFIEVFLGALLGVPAGYMTNALWTRKIDEARRAQLKSAIKSAIDSNSQLIERLAETVDSPGRTPTFNVDTTLFASTSAIKYEILDDIKLCENIDRLHFEISHLSRKIDLLLNLDFSPTARLAIDGPGGSMYNILRPPLVDSIKESIKVIKNLIATVNTKFQQSSRDNH